MDLKRLLQNTERLLHKANIPGIPEEMDARLRRSRRTNFRSHAKLTRSAIKYGIKLIIT